MVVTNNAQVAEDARSLKDLSFSKNERTYLHSQVGYNYRMTNIQAAIGLAQLERIDDFVEMRRSNAKLYNELLSDTIGLTLPPEKEWAKNVYWMYSVLVEPEFGISRDMLIKILKEKGIETRPFFIPMNRQPVFKDMSLFEGEKYPVAEKLSQCGFNLPSSSGLTQSEIEYVCHTIKEVNNKVAV